ncbi:MAG TPA: hypothetical protein O0X23_05475 [Methanocorpusculum sp.]|nr:hypothetical protein [Methanocorpusculum sp.]
MDEIPRAGSSRDDHDERGAFIRWWGLDCAVYHQPAGRAGWWSGSRLSGLVHIFPFPVAPPPRDLWGASGMYGSSADYHRLRDLLVSACLV